MTSKDQHVTSDAFDIPNSIFAHDSNQSKSSLSHHNLCANYLRETIGESLSNALAYMLIYRPDDPIEFISNFLIDWSRKTTHQKVIDHQFNNTLVQSLRNDREEKLVFQSDKHHQDNNSPINPKIDDQQKFSNYFQEQKQHTQHYIHTHDTSTEFDDDDDDKMKSNQENHRCQNGNLSSFTYFSKLRDKIIKCDES